MATRFAKDHPAMLDRLVVMDNIPTRIIFQRMNAEVARTHWFFIFNNVPDLPEALIGGREEIWLRYIFSSWCYNPQLFSVEEIAVYVRAYSQPGALRGAFNDYRAGPKDVVQDEKDEEVLIECPTLVLWGEDFAIGGKMWDFNRFGKRWREIPRSFRAPVWPPSARGKTTGSKRSVTPIYLSLTRLKTLYITAEKEPRRRNRSLLLSSLVLEEAPAV